jgi:hypothetical protein
MFAKAKGIGISACVLLCTLALMGGRANVPPRPRAGIALPPGSGLGAPTVLVEAFVVEVNLPALARLEVSPIGQEPHAVSVADILKCLDLGQARVLGGAKAASRVETRAEVQETKATYVPRQKGAPPQVGFNHYQLVSKFQADVVPVSDTAVSVQFSYGYMRFAPQGWVPDAPPDTDTWSWSSSAVLELGKPQIVVANQSADETVFLILTAHAQGD